MLTDHEWNEIKIGYGFEEVPEARKLAEGLCCCVCGEDWPLETLWTDCLHDDLKIYGNSYCRYHAESMFGPREEDREPMCDMIDLVEKCLED